LRHAPRARCSRGSLNSKEPCVEAASSPAESSRGSRRPAPGRPTEGGRFGVLGTTLSIAAGVGIASLSTYFWIPFLPLYAKELGASSEADAVFWVAVGSTALASAES